MRKSSVAKPNLHMDKQLDKQVNADRDNWRHWLTLNANNLVWIALIVGGILVADWLMPPL